MTIYCQMGIYDNIPTFNMESSNGGGGGGGATCRTL